MTKKTQKLLDELRVLPAETEWVWFKRELRNERHFQIYNFDDGQPIEPDFVLFLKKKDSDISLHYQVFIEPKGEHLLKYDEWKEKFLKSLKKKHQINVLWKSKKYTVWGMPFYNEALKKTEFEDEFRVSFL